MKDRYIIHIDMDAFFAAIEQRDNPALKGKPVIVGADPKAGRGRGVVSTCSYEARKYGVHSAMPISIAYRKCPQAAFLPVDMQKYAGISKQIFSILEAFTPDVEPVSIDEAFLDITDTFQRFKTPLNTCAAIKQRVKQETGLTASIGLAPTKMAAKIASGLSKPDGLLEVKKEKLLDFLRPLDIGLLWGVGKKTKDTMNSIGIYTIADLAKKSKAELIGIFGKNGAWFWDMAQGIDTSEVITEHEAKSISNETTFDKDTADKSRVRRELAWLCELVSGRLREENLKCRALTLKIRLEGFQTYTRSKTFSSPTNFSEDLITIIGQLYDDFEIKDKKIRLVGIRASNFSDASEQWLFKDASESKKEDVHKAVDKIRGKFGAVSICRASSIMERQERDN